MKKVMIKAFLKKAGRRLKRLAGANKKQEREVTESGQELPEKPVGSAGLPLDDGAASGAMAGAGVVQEDEEGRYRRSSPNKRSKKPRWTPAQFPVDPVEGKTRFHDFDLPVSIMHGIADLDFKYCTPIQEMALPIVLEGRDIIGRASTGTGKSAVFLIAVFTRLLNEERENKVERKTGFPRVLIIAPTRELVQQIANDAQALAKYTRLRTVAVYGGMDYAKQEKALTEQPVDVLAATPGRLLDYASRRVVDLSRAGIMVIDEADRMLDMGFIPDVRRIVNKTPPREERQTLLFSATITNEVKDLAAQWCVKPQYIESEPEQMTVDTVEQIVYMTTSAEKYNVLYNLITKEEHGLILVFANMKNEARRLHDRLKRNNIECTLLSGDIPQQKRMARLESFRRGEVKVLVATDVAGRGIHIEGISHVVNYTLPYEPEDYVHRIGRTGRAGAKGISISFACEEGAFYIPDIEEYIGMQLNSVVPPEHLLTPPPKGSAASDGQKQRQPSSRRRRR